MTVFEEDVEKFLEADPERFRYDDDGNLLSDGRFDYTRDGEPPTPRLRAEGSRAEGSGL